MNEDLRRLSRKRKMAHARLLALNSPTYAAFLDLERAAFADGRLPRRTKELVALGISLVLGCESCMQWHLEQAAQAGAEPGEILEALEVGVEMGGGPATVSLRLALDVLVDVFGEEGLARAAHPASPAAGA
jgi:AhpD family alkylhydroperoxidase